MPRHINYSFNVHVGPKITYMYMAQIKKFTGDVITFIGKWPIKDLMIEIQTCYFPTVDKGLCLVVDSLWWWPGTHHHNHLVWGHLLQNVTVLCCPCISTVHTYIPLLHVHNICSAGHCKWCTWETKEVRCTKTDVMFNNHSRPYRWV